MRVLLSALLIATSLVILSAATSSGVADPTRTITVTGTGGQSVSSYPGYRSDIDRFAIRSAAAIDRVSVTASSTDPGASVVINGRPARNGVPLEVTGLRPGDEVNVQITDAAGRSNQSWILTPPGFPLLTASGDHPDLSDGYVFLTLASFLGSPHTAIVDAHGVPVRATADRFSDFKQSAADPARYSAAIPTEGGGYRIAELDGQFRETRSLRLSATPTSTDFHDSVLLDEGGAVLMGYDPAVRDGVAHTDAIIEVQDSGGTPTLTWNSKDHVDEDTEGLVDRSRDDYAHINSLQRLENGDILASFRNLSQVMLIAGSTHDGHAAGEVIWRLGGLRNDFEFVGDPYGGPCAQHAATILEDGRLMIFDNGARRDASGPIATQTADMCPNGADPTGARVARPQSRVTEYELDTSTNPPTATLVWSHQPTGRYAPFAGNAQRLANGNTMVGWSQAEVPAGTTPPVATEVNPAGAEIWSLAANGGYFSYRAFKHPAPDRIRPEVSLESPADGAVVQQGAPLTARFGCTDTGGSNLDTCAGTVPNGTDLSTEVGNHQLTVTATDGSGNTGTQTVSYTVAPAASPSPGPAPTAETLPPTGTPPPSGSLRPDAAVRRHGGAWEGEADYGRRQRVTLATGVPGRLVANVRVRNAGDASGRVIIDGSAMTGWARSRWYAADRDVTKRVVAGTFRTSWLAPGDSVRLRLVVRVVDVSRDRERTLHLATTARDGAGLRDVVHVRITTGR